MKTKYIKLFEDFYTPANPTYLLFDKLKEEYPNEECSEEGLIQSLKLIGDGKITHNEYQESFRYNETNDKYIFVVHGKYRKSSYYKEKGYQYEIGIYKNDPTISYSGTGIILAPTKVINHTRLFGYVDGDHHIHYNKNLISKVCNQLKEEYLK